MIFFKMFKSKVEWVVTEFIIKMYILKMTNLDILLLKYKENCMYFNLVLMILGGQFLQMSIY